MMRIYKKMLTKHDMNAEIKGLVDNFLLRAGVTIIAACCTLIAILLAILSYQPAMPFILKHGLLFTVIFSSIAIVLFSILSRNMKRVIT